MSESGDAQATGDLSVADAAAVFETMLADDGDSEGQEPLEEETPQAEDEPDADEPQGDEEDGDPEEQSDEGDEPETGDEQPPTYRVKVAGEEVEVPLPELIKGYAREADYTRKTMAHADEVKAFDAQRQSFNAERERTTNLLKVLEETFSAPAYTQEQLDYLRQTNPAEFAAAIAEQGERREQARAAEAERLRLEGQSAQDRQQELTRVRQEEQVKLVALRPKWKDPEVLKAAFAQVRDYANSIGVTDDELRSPAMVDARLIVTLHDAAQYRALQAKKPAVQAKVEQVKTVKPGSGSKPGKATDVTRAQQRLAKTGRVEDAAAVFLHLQS